MSSSSFLVSCFVWFLMVFFPLGFSFGSKGCMMSICIQLLLYRKAFGVQIQDHVWWFGWPSGHEILDFFWVIFECEHRDFRFRFLVSRWTLCFISFLGRCSVTISFPFLLFFSDDIPPFIPCYLISMSFVYVTLQIYIPSQWSIPRFWYDSSLHKSKHPGPWLSIPREQVRAKGTIAICPSFALTWEGILAHGKPFGPCLFCCLFLVSLFI